MPVKRFVYGLKARLQQTLGDIGVGFYSFLGCLLVTGIAGSAALVSAQPLLFPSLGPTVLMFFERTLQPAACPRNTLMGHAAAILAGWVSLAVFGLLDAPSVLQIGVHDERIGAAALSLALTALVKHLLRAPHPPAGATTLIVSLGFLTTPAQLTAMMVSVVLVTLSGWSLNRLMGVPMPVWSATQR